MSKYRGNLVHVAEAVRSHGRGGDDVLVHVNPDEFRQMQEMWGEHSVNPYTGLPEYGLFSKLKKALKFESFNVKNIIKDIAKNPQRLLTGAVDPLGTKITNKVFGTKYDPVVNQLGGATEKRFRDAEARGLDTGLARDLHKVAGLVAGFYGAQGLGNLASAGLSNLSQPAANAASSGLGQTVNAAEGVMPIDTSILSSGVPESVSSGLSNLASAGNTATYGANGVGPIDTSILNSGLPESVTSGIEAANPSYAQMALNYAKQPGNWPTIAKGASAVGGMLSNLGGGDEAPPPPAEDPGYNLNTNYPKRNFVEGDYSKYYNYGEGPEHAYYTYGPVPEILPAPEDEHGFASGGQSGGSGNLSHVSRYMEGGPGGGQDDQIDAKLSPKEYVFDATTVAMLGDGNPDHGARKLDAMRRKLWKDRGKHFKKGKLAPKAKDPEGYL